jgi:lysozyme family protein
MTPFDKALQYTIGIEGGYSDDSRDSGGKTRWGITEDVARRAGYTGLMQDLPPELARQIYREQYWDADQLDAVAALAEPIALEMFDTAVNCGTGTPVRFLQRMLNAFNVGATAYPDLTVDGGMGPITLDALRAFLTRRGNLGVQVMVEALNSLQGAYYVDLAERRPKDEAFMFGWFANRVLKRAG